MNNPDLLIEKITPGLAKMLTDPKLQGKYHPILDRSGYSSDFRTPAIIDTAKMFTACCVVDPEHSRHLKAAAAELPIWMFTALVLVCGLRIPLEIAEKTLGWPSRSMKLVIAMGLEHLNRRGFL